MLAPGDLDRLLDDCVSINRRLSSGARRTLAGFLRLRERHGERAISYLSPDDVEMLEDWAASAGGSGGRAEAAAVPRADTAIAPANLGLRPRAPQKRRIDRTPAESAIRGRRGQASRQDAIKA
jgi:hypothetical protein